MNKITLLKHLNDAKKAHMKWVQYAKFVINDLDVDNHKIPVDFTECSFGKWFYDEGALLNQLPGIDNNIIKKIEKEHKKLHDIYFEIYSLFHKNEKKGFWSKIFSKNTIDPQNLEKAKELFNELTKISEQLIEDIEKLENIISTMQESKIEEVYGKE